MIGDKQSGAKVVDVTLPALAIAAVIVAILALRGQASPAPAVATPPSWGVRPGGRIALPVDATGPTAEPPRLVLEIEVLDADTGRRVDDATTWLDGHQVAEGCCPTVTVEASSSHTLTVRAPGYLTFEVMLRPRDVTHSSVIKAPVRLQRAGLEV